jgi:hypothetical protein
VDTTGRGGKPLNKNIVVTTNDLKNATTNLIVKGMVDKLVTISPDHVLLSGPAGEGVSLEVLITPEKKYPFKVVEASPHKGDNIELSFREIVTDDGSLGYKLHVKNLKRVNGQYADKVILKTTSKYQPTISVPVYGNIN